jgi:chromosome segregation ATPase
MLRFAALMGLVILLAARAFAGADDDFIAVYNLIQQADASRDAGQVGAARRAYADAQQKLAELHRSYPTWNERVIAYRQRYVAEKLAALPPDPNAAEPARPAAPATAPGVPAAELAPSGEVISQFNALNAQIAQLANEKKLLEAKLREALSAQPAPVDPRELQQAVERISTLQETNKVLLASLEQQQAERKNLVDKVVAEEAQSALNEANRQLLDQKLGANALAKEKAALEAELKRLQDGELKQLKGENRTLKSQVGELKSDTERGKQIADLSARLAKLQTKLDETSQQNEQLILDKGKLEKQLSDLRARQSEESIVRLSKLETDLAVARADASRINAHAEEVALQLQKEKGARTRLEEDNKSLTARVTALTDQLAAAKQAETSLAAEKAERAELEAQLKLAEERLAATRLVAAPPTDKAGAAAAAADPALVAQLKLLENEASRLRDSVRESFARESELKTLLTESDGQRVRLEQEKTDLLQKLKSAEQAAAATPRAADARTIRSLEAKVHDLEKQRDRLARKLAAASEKAAEAQDAVRRSRLGSPRDRAVEFRQGR